jgi:hypothetical protein
MPTDEPKPDETLTIAVKSRILDRVLAELRDDLGLRSGANGYTKSDGGIYGKYEKADIDSSRILEVIDSRIKEILEEYEDSPPTKSEK